MRCLHVKMRLKKGNAMQGKTIVYDAITVKREGGFAFDVWHQNHYIPSLLATGQMLNVQCYGSPLRATYVAVFESNADAAVLHNALPAPTHTSLIASERHIATFMNEQVAPGAGNPFQDAPLLYPVLFSVPAAGEQDFNNWYDEEHLGILLRCLHWPMCRRFKVHQPAPDSWTHIALHYLLDLRALESKERDEARTTPWRDRLAKHAWFKGDYRVLYKFGMRRI
jgi:hypothetical protein